MELSFFQSTASDLCQRTIPKNSASDQLRWHCICHEAVVYKKISKHHIKWNISFCSHLAVNSSLITHFSNFDKWYKIRAVTYIALAGQRQPHTKKYNLFFLIWYENFILHTMVCTLAVCTAFMHIIAKGDGFNCWNTVLLGIYWEENLPHIEEAVFCYNDQMLQAAQHSLRTFFSFVDTKGFIVNVSLWVLVHLCYFIHLSKSIVCICGAQKGKRGTKVV